MLWYIPLEYLDKRYTVLMDKQLQQGFQNYGIKYTEVSGECLTDKIETGAFLDSDGTNYFKFSQLQNICHLFKQEFVKDGDIFFVSDLWFPGLIAIPYMSMFHEIKTKICGIMHAGSWTDTDFVRELKSWAGHIERGWFELADMVFVGSDFHKQDILAKNRCTDVNKIIVTGLPFDTTDIRTEKRIQLMQHKDNIVVLTGRLDDEKQPWLFDELAERIQVDPTIKGSVQFIKTMEKDLDKESYFDLLALSKVVFSAALQENFGYGILEATALGCFPVVPNSLAYVNIYPACYRYDTIEQAYNLIKYYLTSDHTNICFIADAYNDSVNNIMERIGDL